ncbi:MAG: hypothetical protein OXI16_08540 [Chloroflexota bacterium]|nr:hypothetical protein [Chloroflexota bacterium]
MTHAYITPDALKSPSALNITGTANDDRLLALAEAASGAIDRWCNRHFYARRATIRLDGNGESTIGVPDLVSVDGVRIYGGIRGPATRWSAGDYDLLPYDADPASAGNPYSRPYTRLLATGAAIGRAIFPAGRGNVEVEGVWGWWQHLRRISRVVGANAGAGAATILLSAAVSGSAEVGAGNTLLIGEEQLYVQARDGDSLAVRRGVNGTTAALIAQNAPIDIYEYPPPVGEAALLLAVRLWHGARGGVDDWQTSEIGMDSDIGLLLGAYRKPALGVY